MSRFFSWFTLFSSVSTLVCCAIPALLISLGLGATVAGMVSSFPGIVLLSEKKELVFIMAFMFLLISGSLMWANKDAPCPIDPKLAKLCMVQRERSKYIYIVSVVLFAVGAFTAFILPLLS